MRMYLSDEDYESGKSSYKNRSSDKKGLKVTFAEETYKKKKKTKKQRERSRRFQKKVKSKNWLVSVSILPSYFYLRF